MTSSPSTFFVAKLLSAAAAAFLIAKMNMYQLSRLVDRARV
jgi:hypothetical protein